MKSAKTIIKNAAGLHLRPAGFLCESAMKFPCKVTFSVGDTYEANAKSVLSVLGACVQSGQEITICCDGEQEDEALEYMLEVIENGLGE